MQLLTPKADLRTDGAERIRIANRPRAGLCKVHKARFCELGANPRQLPRPEDLKYIVNIFTRIQTK